MSSKMFGEVNENDAVASLKAYARIIAESRGFTADPNPRIFSGTDQLTQLLKRGESDLVSILAQEYLALEGNLVTGPILIPLVNGSDYEEYVLLVRNDSGATTLADLHGRRVLVLDSLAGSLARPWLEVLLGQQALAPPVTFFSRVTPVPKTSQTVLPVFFRQADACVITRQGFALMGELNPQVTKQLRVLATSPQLVPRLTCFRAGFDPALKERIVAAVTEAYTTTAGRQLMTIFQCDRIVERPLARLQSTQELLAAWARVRGQSGRVAAVGNSSPSSPRLP